MIKYIREIDLYRCFSNGDLDGDEMRFLDNSLNVFTQGVTERIIELLERARSRHVSRGQSNHWSYNENMHRAVFNAIKDEKGILATIIEEADLAA